MPLVFIIVALAGGAYFLMRKRSFDCFSLAYFSSLIYFSPAFAGFVPTYSFPVTTGIVPGVYVVCSLVLLGLTAAAFLYDELVEIPVRGSPLNVRGAGRRFQHVRFFLFTVALVGFVGNLLVIDTSLFAGGSAKRDLLEANTLFYNFWVYPSMALCVVSFYSRAWWYFGIAIALLVLDLVLYSMRAHFVMALLSVLFFYLASQNRVRLISKVRFSFLWVPVAVVFVVFKSIIQPLRSGDYGLLFERLFSSDTYVYWLSRAEPFNQMAILNSVIENEFQSPFSQIPQAALSIVPYSGSLFFSINPRFHDYWQPELFPHIAGRIGNNPWAQMLSVGGWLMLAVSLLCYLWLIFLMNHRLVRSNSEVVRVSLLLIVPIICFYMHRNDIYFTLLMCKRLLLVFLAAYVFGMVINGLFHKRMHLTP